MASKARELADVSQEVEKKQDSQFLVGQVCYFAMTTVPEGFLKSNGAEVSQVTYSNLFAAIGSTYVDEWSTGLSVTEGDLYKTVLDGTIYKATSTGTTSGTDITDDTGVTWEVAATFYLPDLRGEFPRGWDDGRGVDDGRGFGTAQLDQMQRITGEAFSTSWRLLTNFGGSGAMNVTATGSNDGPQASSGNGSRINFDSANSPNARSSATTDGETRPRNIALLACIKF